MIDPIATVVLCRRHVERRHRDHRWEIRKRDGKLTGDWGSRAEEGRGVERLPARRAGQEAGGGEAGIVSSRHVVRPATRDLGVPAVEGHATGFRGAGRRGRGDAGAVHTGFAIVRARPRRARSPGTSTATRTACSCSRVRSSCDTGEGAFLLRPGRLRRHRASERRTRSATSRTRPRGGRRCWRRSPGRGVGGDTYVVPAAPRARPGHRSTSRDPRTRSFGHIDRGEHGCRQADAGHARGLGEHADRAARLQRDHREDDGRRGPRRAAAHDVHGAVRAATGSPAGTTTRSRRRT